MNNPMNKMIVKLMNVLSNQKAEMYVDKAVWVIGVLLVGAGLVYGLYTIFGGTIMTSIEKQIQTFLTNAKTNTVTDGTEFSDTASVIG